MQTVGIYDRIDLIYKETPGITVETNLYYLPDNENNLVYKAAKLLMVEFHVQKGVHIRLRNIFLLQPVWQEEAAMRQQCCLASIRCFPWD